MKKERKREKLSYNSGEGQGAIKGEGGGEEPTREGRRSEPVERRVPVADTLPNALQSGVVRCPPHPRGAGREGRQAGREGMTPGKEGTTPMAHVTDGHRTHEERKGRGIKQDETKQKQREKSRLVDVWSLGSGHTLEGGRGGCQARKEGRSRVSLLPSASGPAAVRQDSTSL